MTIPKLRSRSYTDSSFSRYAVKAMRFVPVVLTVTIIVICVAFLSAHDFNELLDYTPENYFLAFLVFMGFYGLKSLSVVFPLTALFVAVGAVYPFWVACGVNILGLAVCYTVPYLVGRLAGGGLVKSLVRKYPKAKKLVDRTHENDLFAAYITRAVIVVPGDIVSMLHGALRMPFRAYLLGSVIGTVPQMLVQTYLGSNINDLSFKMVLVLIGLTVLTTLMSLPLNKKVTSQWVEADQDAFYVFDYFDEWDDGSI
ncbi:MAG: TVP38/TMEM64 family protein [Ruminococcus sp.]|nr:TVP38/TMEM64 family protein [Ruminococcus sp.]